MGVVEASFHPDLCCLQSKGRAKARACQAPGRNLQWSTSRLALTLGLNDCSCCDGGFNRSGAKTQRQIFDFDMAAALLWVLRGGWRYSLGWISRVGLQGAWSRCPRERHFAVLVFAALEKKTLAHESLSPPKDANSFFRLCFTDLRE
jgi:hypothetical protein